MLLPVVMPVDEAGESLGGASSFRQQHRWNQQQLWLPKTRIQIKNTQIHKRLNTNKRIHKYSSTFTGETNSCQRYFLYDYKVNPDTVISILWLCHIGRHGFQYKGFRRFCWTRWEFKVSKNYRCSQRQEKSSAARRWNRRQMVSSVASQSPAAVSRDFRRRLENPRGPLRFPPFHQSQLDSPPPLTPW